MVGQCPSEVLAPADGLPEIRQGDVVPLGIQGEVVSHDTDDSASGACYCRSTPGNVARMLGGDNSIYSRLSPQRDAHWSLQKRSLYSVQTTRRIASRSVRFVCDGLRGQARWARPPPDRTGR